MINLILGLLEAFALFFAIMAFVAIVGRLISKD